MMKFFQLARAVLKRISPSLASEKRPKRVLLVVQTYLNALYLSQVSRILAEDPQCEVFVTRAPTPAIDASPAHQLGKWVGARSLPFVAAALRSWDLIFFSEHASAWFDSIPGRKVFISHGLYSGVQTHGKDYVFSQGRRAGGRLLYDRLFVASQKVAERGVGLEPELKGRIEVVGDPLADHLLESDRRRNEIRTSLQLNPNDMVILLLSSWGTDSLFATLGDALLNEAKKLLPRYRFVISAHPHNFFRKTEAPVGDLLLRQRREEFLLAPPGEDWAPYLAAADLAISDRTSLSLYFALLKRPMAFIPFSEKVPMNSPVARLAKLHTQLGSPPELGATIQRALAASAPQVSESFLDEIVDCLGQARQRYREAIYRELGLPLAAVKPFSAERKASLS